MPGELDLFVFVDALGWSLVSERAVLTRVCPHRQQLDSVLGYSCTCIPTILTGLKPQEHGHFAFFRYRPEHSPFRGLEWLALLPDRITRSHRVRSWLSKLVGAWLGYTGYFNLYNVPFRMLPLLDYSEKRDLYRSGGIVSGAPTVFDELDRQGIPYHVSDWRARESVNVQALEDAIRRREPRIGYLYLAGLDALLHRDGTRSRACDAKLAQYDTWLERLLEVADENYRQVRLHVFSDHGMADVSKLVDIEGRLAASGLRQGEDYVGIFDSTMARLWLLKDRAEEPIRRVLSGSPEGRLLDADDLEGYGCRFPGREYGEMMFLMEAGTMIFPNHMGAKPMAGMHGYDPAQSASHAAYLATHPPPVALSGLRDIKGLILASCGARAPVASTSP